MWKVRIEMEKQMNLGRVQRKLGVLKQRDGSETP